MLGIISLRRKLPRKPAAIIGLAFGTIAFLLQMAFLTLALMMAP